MNTSVHLLVHELAVSWTHDLLNNDGRLGLIALLEDEPGPTQRGSAPGGRAPGSRPPWDSETEELLALIDTGARILEAELRYALEYAEIDRGASRANTLHALRALPDLLDTLAEIDRSHRLARGPRHPKRGYRPGLVQRELAYWHRQARNILGATVRCGVLPADCTATVGEGETERPCGARAIRQVPGGSQFRCCSCGELYADDELHDLVMANLPSDSTPPTDEGDNRDQQPA